MNIIQSTEHTERIFAFHIKFVFPFTKRVYTIFACFLGFILLSILLNWLCIVCSMFHVHFWNCCIYGWRKVWSALSISLSQFSHWDCIVYLVSFFFLLFLFVLFHFPFSLEVLLFIFIRILLDFIWIQFFLLFSQLKNKFLHIYSEFYSYWIINTQIQ